MAQSYVAFGGAETSRRLAADGQGTFASPLVPLFGFGDTAVIDAFGRLRVSAPEYVFDAQLTYDLQPLLYEQVTAQSGATITHDATNRCALMTFASTPTGGALGTLSVLATGYTGTAPCRVTINWREVR